VKAHSFKMEPGIKSGVNPMKKKIFSIVLILDTLALRFSAPPVIAAEPGKAIELLLNEGSGSTARDSSGNSNNATIYGAAWNQLASGKWVLDFNGSSNYLRTPDSSTFNFNGSGAAVSLETWVNFKQNSAMMVLGNGSGGSSGGYAIYFTSTRTMGYIEGNSQNKGWFASISNGTPIITDTWYHIVYTYDGLKGRMYCDGVPAGTSADWSGGIYSTLSSFYVYSSFAGRMGKIAVYDHALSLTEVEAKYNAEKSQYLATSQDVEVFVYPAITNNKIIPTTSISEEYRTDLIQLDGSPDEYRAATFVVKAPFDIEGLSVNPGELTGSQGTIGLDSIDIKTVACWFQAGNGISDVNHLVLTPELLVNDDTLIKVENANNYVKLTDGSYRWISDPNDTVEQTQIIPVSELPISDSPVWQPVEIQAGMNKQFWMTVHIPAAAAPGVYDGTITLDTADSRITELHVNLTVHPIDLAEPYLTYSGYYAGKINAGSPDGSISYIIKSEDQLTAELQNMVAHGLANPLCAQGYGNLEMLAKVLNLRNSLGMGDKPLYYTAPDPWGYQSPELVQYILNLVGQYGIEDVYFYGIDEAQGDELLAQRESWQAIQAAGGKVFASGYPAANGNTGTYGAVGDILDLFVNSGAPSAAEAALWHSQGHQIFSYGNPQMGEEAPGTYRRNYGLLLWQNDFDGAMDFAYQWGFGNIWNDFDSADYRDHNMTYPTINGVIDTIQWEGFREGVNDIRYLTTLLQTIQNARKAGVDTSEAEGWLAEIKQADLTGLDLEAVRADMIKYILALQTAEAEPQLATIVVTPTATAVESTIIEGGVSSVIVVTGESQAFSAQGYDLQGNQVNDLTFEWSINDSSAGSIDGEGQFIAAYNPGTYIDVIQVTAEGVTAFASITVISAYEIWDLNQDGETNVLDLILVGQHMQESGEPGWIPEDINRDGSVNSLDTEMILLNFNR